MRGIQNGKGCMVGSLHVMFYFVTLAMLCGVLLCILECVLFTCIKAVVCRTLSKWLTPNRESHLYASLLSSASVMFLNAWHQPDVEHLQHRNWEAHTKEDFPPLLTNEFIPPLTTHLEYPYDSRLWHIEEDNFFPPRINALKIFQAKLNKTKQNANS